MCTKSDQKNGHKVSKKKWQQKKTIGQEVNGHQNMGAKSDDKENGRKSDPKKKGAKSDISNEYRIRQQASICGFAY